MSVESSMRARSSWSLCDQALASGSNVIAAVVAANLLSSREFGIFAVVFAVYQLSIGLIRATVGEPALSESRADARRRLPTGAISGALVVGVACAVLVGFVALAGPRSARGGLGWLAAALPFLAVQDVERYAWFSARRPQAAVALDAIWLVLQLMLSVALLQSTTAGVGAAVLVWAVPGAVSAVLGLLASRARLTFATAWLRRHRGLSARYATEFVLISGVSHGALLVLTWVSDLEAVAGVRAVQVVFGPVNVLYSAALAVIVPEGARLRAEPPALLRLLVRATVLLCVCAGAALLFAGAIPDRLGRALFDDTWALAAPLVLPAGLVVIAGAVVSGAFAGLRALRAASASMRARALTAPLAFGLPVLGGAIGGSRMFLVAQAVATAFSAAVWWGALRRQIRSGVEIKASPPEAPLRADAELGSL